MRWALSLLPLLAAPSAAAESKQRYTVGQSIPVTCLDRNFTTGEHKTDAQGRLHYIPFPACSETGKPLELGFGVEKEFNCTIEIDDPLFHLLEFYVVSLMAKQTSAAPHRDSCQTEISQIPNTDQHSDAPMTCRVPARPLTLQDASDPSAQIGVEGSEDSHYIPLVVALAGLLQKSHIHISNNLNVLVHAAPKAVAPGVIDSATAYSISHQTRNTKIIPGTALPLRLSVRWYPSTVLPSGWAGVGGHLFLSTLLYCILSAGGATAICIAYYRGVALPKRLRSHGWERAFATERTRYNGYGYGVGNGYGYAGPGKVE